MNAKPRVWWKRRRFLAPAGALLLIAMALATAILRSDTSQIIIYNDTGAAIGPLSVRACGQSQVLPEIPDETSVWVRLKAGRGAGPVELSLPVEPAWHWEGSYMESHGGYLVFIHLRHGMEVEENTQISFWQQLLYGRNPGE